MKIALFCVLNKSGEMTLPLLLFPIFETFVKYFSKSVYDSFVEDKMLYKMHYIKFSRQISIILKKGLQ